MNRASTRIKYQPIIPGEFLTKVRGEFGGMANIGDAKNSIIIFEGEFGPAECEALLLCKDNEWYVGIGVGEKIKYKVKIDPTKNYQYLVEVIEPGWILYTVRSEGEVIFEWECRHGGRPEHSYFNHINTSLEAYAKDGCSSGHRACHSLLWVWDDKDQKWLRSTEAFVHNFAQSDDSTYVSICEEVTPNLRLTVIHHESNILNDDTCIAYYEGADTLPYILHFSPYRYDRDNDGKVTLREAIQAIQDYFSGYITKAQAIEVVKLRFG